jgi:DNA-binding transcriptional MocR family regulator
MPTNWTTRVWQEYRAGNLTRAYRDVLLTLRTFRGTGGVCTPSHNTLAERARCSPSTVLRACQQARQLGLLDWFERRVRRGWRWLRTSNAYRFAVPAGDVQAVDRAARRTNHQPAAGGESPSKKRALTDLMQLAASAGDLLLARRRVMEARLLGNEAAARPWG